ncbi:SPOR domain-containing protein [Treponema ruminis]|uniref:SPOR domain-containing protein n=1 Tax=Treponema ruminis TaxID=744515 RepID=A0A7W8G6Q3_9SPIR|nr:SPOR domain-containing protein [Treponema ruminis]MBB5224744.1 hypothetical protein [Treponema ruminis]
MKLKHFFTILIFFFVTSFSFSEDWFVCLGSFSDLKNARNYSLLLKANFFKNRIALAEVNGRKVYRVLYDSVCDSKEKARLLSERIYQRPYSVPCKLDDLWICTADEFLSFDDYGKTNSADSLKSNDINEIPLSDEKPYSVQVGSYKEESPAKRDQERLQAKNIDAYILKTYDDDTYISFDLHAGAFKTKEESEELQKELENIGIQGTKVSDFEDIKDSVEKFNSLASSTNISYGEGVTEIPDIFPEEVKTLISEFPINPNFQIETIEILDVENISETGYSESDFINERSLINNFDNVSAISKAVYKDDLYNKKIIVRIFSGSDGRFAGMKDNFLPNEGKEAFQVDFWAKTQVFNCYFYKQDGVFNLLGTTKDENQLISMEALNFSDEEFTALLGDMTNDSNLLIYPEVRKNLLTLPKKSSATKRDFVYFKLKQIGDDYAEERGYVNWARAIVGHWQANSYFIQDGKKITTGFFDLDYDYNSKQVHTQFMEAHEAISIDEKNHPSDIFDEPGWYVGSHFLNSSNELSFAKKSYIIAINSYEPDCFSEEALKDLAKDLQIWDK